MGWGVTPGVSTAAHVTGRATGEVLSALPAGLLCGLRLQQVTLGKEEVPPSGTKGSLLTACRGRRTLGVPQLRARRPPRPCHGECLC